jgi:TolB-like protein/Tfp pilus assembly protein PilF
MAEASGKLIRMPTGDGMALLFFHSPEEPVRCALEISRSLQGHSQIHVRMGVHSGPVSPVKDVNDQTNIAGSGINVAQRVLDCGDAGHILLSGHVAEDLTQYRHWQPYLQDLGECEVKHGLRLHLFNLYKDGLGNPQIPEKLKRRGWKQQAAAIRPVTPPRSPKFLLRVALVVLAIALAASVSIFLRRGSPSVARIPVEGSPTASIPEKSIAVLPFENRSEDKANAYFADGIQDEILTRLSKIADLKVISRPSTQHYKSAPENLPDIAKQLGVAHILEGSVQKSADAVRVNVQLIKAANDSHLWADTFDRKLTDIFSVESEVAKAIADQLRAKLSGQEEQVIAAKPTDNVDAYDAYLRGLAFYARSTYSDQAMAKAIGFFERAVQLDPNFAQAWARLSRANAFLYFRQGDTTASRRDAVKTALEHAQKVQPNSPDTLLALGYYEYWVLRDFDLARATFQLASKLLPGSSDVPFALGAIARRQGQWNVSIGYLEQALAVDPRNAELLIHAADTHIMVRDFPVALNLYDRALDIVPNDTDLRIAKAGIYQALGSLKEAARWLPQINAQSTEAPFNAKIVIQFLLERNQQKAVPFLQARQAQFHFGSGFYESPNFVNLAFVQRLAGDIAGAKLSAEQGRAALDSLCRAQPENAMFGANLSQAYATLGNKEAALKEAQRAMTLLPAAKDAVDGPEMQENLALIEMIVGENSRAVSTLRQLLETPYDGWYYVTPVTPALLRLDPTWDPLRSDPRFQKLIFENKP